MKLSSKHLAVFTLLALAAIAPDARGQWVPVSGPYGGNATGFASIGSLIFAASPGSGIYESTDDGATWIAVTQPSWRNNPFSLLTVGSTLLSTGGFGLSASTDSGLTWSPALDDYSFVSVYGFVTDSGTLYCVTEGDVRPGPTPLLISTDTGRTWRQPWDSTRLYPRGEIHTLAVLGTNLYAGSNSGIFRSSDSGRSWIAMGRVLGDTVIQSLFTVGNSLFATTGTVSLACSTDNGQSWVRANRGIDTQYVNTLMMAGQKLLAGTGSGVFVSSDTGLTWTLLGLVHCDVYALFVAGGNLLAGTYDSGLYLSSDGGSHWHRVGINWLEDQHLAVIDSTVFVTTWDGYSQGYIYRSPDKGQSWISATDETLATYLFDPATFLHAFDSELYIGAVNNYNLVRSTNQGVDWTSIGGRFPTGGSVYFLCKQGDALYAGAGGSRIFLSYDNGKNWVERDSGLTLANGTNVGIFVLAASGPNLLAGTLDHGVFFSSDSGLTWRQANNGGLTTARAFAIKGRYAFAGTDSGGVYRSSDNGETWQQSNNGLEHAKQVNNLAVIGPKLFAASSDTGVFLSVDDGATWLDVSTGLPGRGVNEIAIVGSDLFATTKGFSLWHRPISEMIGLSSVPQTKPTTNSLTCYPNPLTSSTTITLSSAAAGFAEITVVNIVGIEVARVFAGEVDAGERTVTWQKPSDLPAGMYECIVRMNGRAERVGMMVE